LAVARAARVRPRIIGHKEPGGDIYQAMSKRHARLGPHHALTVIVTAVIAAVVAYVVLGWLVGLVAFLIKTAVVVCVVVLAAYLVIRWASRHGS
jgi:hypothetical protein